MNYINLLYNKYISYSYKRLLKKCKKYDTILVSGPQRSGTTFVGMALARDLGYQYVDEGRFRTKNLTTFSNIVNKESKKVVQCPDLTQHLHQFDIENCLVIFMQRDDADIIASEDRIGWHVKYFKRRQEIYKHFFPELDVDFFDRSSPMKKYAWKYIQKPLMKMDYIDVPFKISKQIDGFVPKKLRKNFKSKQTLI